MNPTRRILSAAALLVVVFALPLAVLAATSTTTATQPVANQPVYVTLEASTSASVIAADDGSHNLTGKTGWVGVCSVNGQDVYLLIRLQEAGNGIWLDVLASDTAANLDTLAGASDLSTVTSSAHPSPTEDACDTALIADAQ
jgi:hypothetical protein